MPVAFIPLEETNRTILSASYYKIIQQVLHQTNVPYGTLIAMHKGMEINPTDNQSNMTSQQLSNLPSTVAQRRVKVDIAEEYNEDALGTTAVSYKDAPPIFVDPQIDLLIYPVFVSTDVTLQISYTTPSKTEANKLRDELRIKLSQMRNILHHEVEYDILLPLEAQELIADCHQLKNRLYPMELSEYFHTFATRQAYMLTDTANPDNAQIAIRERQVRIVGRFDFNPMPEAVEEDRDNNTYRLTIPYKFTMEVARGMCVSYNPTVCNKLMPSKYLKWVQENKIKTREEYSRNLTYTQSGSALSHFEAHRQLDYRIQNKLPLNLPLFDEFPLRQGHRGYVITTTFMTAVNEDDRRTLFNLKEIPDFYMNEQLLEFIRAGEAPYVVRPYQSLFYFGLHYPDRYFDFDCLEISSDYVVKSNVKLPLDKPTRVSFSVLGDPVFVTKEMIDRWYKNKPMVLLYLREFIEVLRNYKHELRDVLADEMSFQLLVLRFLQRGINDKDAEFLDKALKICSLDNLVYERLINLLKIKYTGVFNQLIQLVDIANTNPHKTIPPIGDDAGEIIAMHTVMTAYTEAHRKPQ